MQIYKYILILILIYSCDNPTSSNIPIDVPGDFTNYQTNLYSLNSGQYLDQITINWNTYTEGSFLQYSIHGQDNEILESIEDPSLFYNQMKVFLQCLALQPLSDQIPFRDL